MNKYEYELHSLRKANASQIFLVENLKSLIEMLRVQL